MSVAAVSSLASKVPWGTILTNLKKAPEILDIAIKSWEMVTGRKRSDGKTRRSGEDSQRLDVMEGTQEVQARLIRDLAEQVAYLAVSVRKLRMLCSAAMIVAGVAVVLAVLAIV